MSMTAMIRDYEEAFIRQQVCRNRLDALIEQEPSPELRRKLVRKRNIVDGMMTSTSESLFLMRQDEEGMPCR